VTIPRRLLLLLLWLLALVLPAPAHASLPHGGVTLSPPLMALCSHLNQDDDGGPLTLHLDGLHDRAGPRYGFLVRQNPWSKFDPEGLNETWGGNNWFANWVLPDPVAHVHASSAGAETMFDGCQGGVDRVAGGLTYVGNGMMAILSLVPGEAAIEGGLERLAGKAAARVAEREVAEVATEKVAQGAAKAEKGAAKEAEEAVKKCEGEITCFPAGTLVAIAGGEQVIETIHVGERVLTSQEDCQNSDTEVDPVTWRVIDLHMPNPDRPGDEIRFEVLRPVQWMTQVGCVPQSDIWFEWPELGARGMAHVDEVHPCPPIANGKGRIVMGTLNHLHGQILDLHFANSDQSLFPTQLHALYSEDRHDWVRAFQLHVGELLRTQLGTVAISSIEPLPGVQRVYNMEVESDHRYYVGDLRVLSHNATECGKLYEVGQYSKMDSAPGTNLHHVPGSAAESTLVAGESASKGTAIRIAEEGEHRAVTEAQAALPAQKSARDLLAKETKILREHTDAPNSSLQEIIARKQAQHPLDYGPIAKKLGQSPN
jgi:hypothetical protein